MSDHHAGTIWKAILGLCDEVEDLRTRQREGIPSGPGSVRSELRRRRTELRNLLEKELRTGTLSELCGQQKLRVDEAELLVVLLRQYVDPRSPWLTGRELLEHVAEDTFTRLNSINILAPTAPLRAFGIVTTERNAKGPGHDPLDTRFRLSDLAAGLFYDAPDDEPKAEKKAREPRPYRSNREYLLDLRALAEFCRRRSHCIYGLPDAEGRRPEPGDRRKIEKKIRTIARHIEQDLLATGERERLPMVAFQSEFALTPEESLIVVDLLFAELIEGEAALEAVELLQMVSRDEEDLLRRRRMLSHDSVLVTKGILVQRERAEEEHDRPPRVLLADWVKDRILGDDTAGREIAPDERIDFHLYLRELDNSARFYRDLAGGSTSDDPPPASRS